MSNQIDTEKGLFRTREMHGRRVITSDAVEITSENIVSELRDALVTHHDNSSEIDYLWNYYKGDQPVLHRVKEVRPEICNKIVENRANEIVSFKVGYVFGEPIQYISKSGDANTSEIEMLNAFMFAEDKEAKDVEIGEWQMVCGTAFRMVLPDSSVGDIDAESPFNIYTLDPRNTFIVYSNGIDHRPLMSVTYTTDKNHVNHFSIYTKDTFYEIDDDIIVSATPHRLGMCPVFEYPANSARMGSFEVVLPLLDAINNLDSNSMDAVEQTIQAFIKFINCDIDEEQFKALKEMGAIKVKSLDGQQADVDMVTNDINQSQTHTLKEDLYNAVLTICGMPNRNGGSSTSDTGTAVIYRDGWSTAEGWAKGHEKFFKRSEKKMLKLVLAICRESGTLSLLLRDVEMKFTRRNYEAIQSKSQVLVQMLSQSKIHPLLAFTHCGMFTDPEEAYSMSQAYYDQEMAKIEAQQVDETEDDEKETGDSNLNDDGDEDV